MRGTRGAEGRVPSFTRGFSVPFLGASFRNRRGRPRMSFESLAKQQKFDVISKQLSSHKIDWCVLKSWLEENCAGGENALHRLVRYKPPSHLVNTLAKSLIALEQEAAIHEQPIFLHNGKRKGRKSTPSPSDPKKDIMLDSHDRFHDLVLCIPEEACDRQGRTPLHIAAEAGCHLKVIDRLLAGTTLTMPAIVKDDRGRCPLHWACTNPSGEAPDSMVSGNERGSTWSLLGTLRKNKQETHSQSSQTTLDDATTPSSKREGSRMDNMACVICRLAAVYPEAVSIRDEDGFTPLDLAVLSEANESTLFFLRQAAKLHKKKGPDDAVSFGAKNTENEAKVEMPPMDCFCAAFGHFPDDISSIGWGYDTTSINGDR